MKSSGFVLAMCGIAAAASGVEVAPGVDAGVVKNGVFESPWFKFKYELPKGWKALDDAKRVAANLELRDEYAHPAYNANIPASKKKREAAKPSAAASAATPVATPVASPPRRAAAPGVPDNFSLMIASPDGVDSVGSAVLPRINIWANHKIPGIDTPQNRARRLESMGRAVMPADVVSINGRDFAREEIVHVNGLHHALWVTLAGDYLIGFEVRADSDVELQSLLETLRTVQFY